MGAAAAAPVLPNAGGAAGDLVDRCGTFVATDIRIRRLLIRWGDLESDVVANHNWFKLSRKEQLELPPG